MKMIKGENLEKQMAHVDRILKSYSHRLHKTVTGVITPFPISGYSEVPVNDIVLRYMFPANGKVVVGGVFIEDMPKNGVNILTTICHGSSMESRTFFSKKQSIVIEPNADVIVGDRLIVKVLVAKSEESVSGIWTAFTWVPEVKDSVIKQFLIKDIEKNEENMDALFQV